MKCESLTNGISFRSHLMCKPSKYVQLAQTFKLEKLDMLECKLGKLEKLK